MKETLQIRLLRWYFNLFACYRRTGGRLTYLAPDFREARVTLPLNRKTRNYVGTLFGGSIYGAVDPIYMVMLIRILGPAYRVWDKSATIRFLRPGRGSLFARFLLTEEEIAAIRAEVDGAGRSERIYTVELADAEGTVHATVEKTLHISRRPNH